jgi:iron complex outermembrane receptor protein
MKKVGKGRAPGFHQICIAMKLTTLLLTTALMQAHAGGMAQNVSLSGQHLTLKSVFSKIKQQTGYAFFYNYSLLKEAHPVDLDVKDMPLTKVLDLCFTGQPLDYAIENKTVVITERPEPPADPTIAALPDVTVRGRVVDDKGNPVVGASVKVKGRNTGTSTDADGVFTLKVPEGSVLIISSIGSKADPWIFGDAGERRRCPCNHAGQPDLRPPGHGNGSAGAARCRRSGLDPARAAPWRQLAKRVCKQPLGRRRRRYPG